MGGQLDRPVVVPQRAQSGFLGRRHLHQAVRFQRNAVMDGGAVAPSATAPLAWALVKEATEPAGLAAVCV
jgi:hypothetical protein